MRKERVEGRKGGGDYLSVCILHLHIECLAAQRQRLGLAPAPTKMHTPR